MNRTSLLKTALAALFAALIAAGAFIRIPLPPVPITLQTLFALIAALLLPLSVSLPAVLVYLFLGIIGLPIFTSGGGIAAITGPTGGYLIGLVPACIAGGLMMKRTHSSIPWALLSAFVATVFVYIPGLLQLSYTRHMDLAATLSAGLLPFIIGDALKIIISAVVAVKVYPQLNSMLNSAEN